MELLVMTLHQHTRFLYRRMLLPACATLILVMAGIVPVIAGETKGENKSSSYTGSLADKLFQNSVSKADGDRCPMYPSCSHYASKALERHGAIKGWILTFDRLLRCGHDEVRRSPKIRVKSGLRTYDPLEANTRWWRRP